MVIDNGYPENTANFLSRLTFYWVQRIFTVGNKRPLTEDDIFPIDPRLHSERLTALLEQQWFREEAIKKKPSLLVTLLKRHLYTISWVFVAANVEGVLRCFTPYLIARITSYFDSSNDMTLKTAMMWVGILLGINLFSLSLRSPLFFHIMRFGSSIRVAVTGLIYRKACRITQREIGDKSVGLIINLITNDAQRLDEYIVPSYVLLNIWAVLLVSFLIMYNEIGIYATVAGFSAMIIFVPFQFLVGKFIIYLRNKIAPLTDSRVKIVHEIVSFMKIIKMYGWELMFKEFVEKIRLAESRYIGVFVLMKACNNAVLYISPIFSLFVVITVKRSVNESMTSTEILFFLASAGVLRVYLNVFLGHAFTGVPQVFHSLGRIQDFLNASEITHLKKEAAIMNLSNEVIVNKNFIHAVEEKAIVEQAPSEKPCYEEAVVLSDLCAGWGDKAFYLSDIQLSIKRGELIAVVGPVACGKTTLLMSLIRELETISGTVTTSGKITYSSQLPWIFNGTVEENITFNRELDTPKLNKIIEACYLTKDLEDLSDGLYTIVGERGVQLSGGQRARISLARAVYGDEPIVLLDDPLSAVDSRCAKHIFNKLIRGALHGKTRILVTHATHFLPQVDKIVVMDTETISRGANGDSSLANGTNNGDGKIVRGRIAHVGSYKELTDRGINLSMFVAVKEKKHRTLSQRSQLSSVEGDEEESEEEEEEKIAQAKPEQIKEEKKTGALDKRLYFRYLGLGMGYLALPFLLVALVAPQILDVYQQQYLLDWAGNRSTGKNYTSTAGSSLPPLDLEAYDTEHYNIYIGLAFGAILLFVLKPIFFVLLINRSCTKLHNQALYAILRSPMRYFDTHPIGIIINRFSKDTYFMDERFPDVLLEFLGLLLLYSASVGLVVYANYWFIFVLAPLIVLTVLCIRYYLSTSMEIRRMEATMRSPLLSHISATLAGLTTIRAHNQIDIYESKHYHMRDEHTRCWMLFNAASRWLAVRLDFMALSISMTATVLCVLLKDQMGAAVAGLALVYVNNMIGGFQWCVRQSTETENMMTAIERIFSFAELPPEAPLEIAATGAKTSYHAQGEVITNSKSVASHQIGVLEFRNVKLRYNPEADYILHELSFVTKPAEKIGIVGRTGAGKSSILQALFRMVEPEGDILIDGQLTREMGLHHLRRSISIIPQESLLFSASLRVNLDPFHEFSDEKLWDVLAKVELKSYFSAQDLKLDSPIQEGGGNLSAGQRQLLCLARALLRENSLLVIDEATANVDEKTDHLIQDTLRVKFSNCTVLTIAHRINTIIDSDRIMVMDSGRLVEFDHPALLLQDKDSIFHDLAKETGMFAMLEEQANTALAKQKRADSYQMDSSEFNEVALI